MSGRTFAKSKGKSSTPFSPMFGKKLDRTFTPEPTNGGHDITNQRFGHDFSRVSVHTVAPMMIQTRLIIGRPGDKYEQEADRVASYVADKTSFVPKLSVRERSAHPIQRQEAKKPPTEEEKYKEAAKKAGEAFLETPVGKRIIDKAKKLGEDFVSTLPGKVVTGVAAAGAVTAIVAKNIELPIQPPAIPLDKVAPGLSMKITYKGPVLNPTAASIAFTYKFGGAKKGSEKPAKTESERIRGETARLARELHEFRESLKTPEQKAEDEAFMQWYILHKTSDPTSPLYIPGLVPKKEAPTLEGEKWEEETPLQRKEANLREAAPGIPSIVHEVLRSPGQPLDAATRAFMEPRFGHDFSHVRVHTDSLAAESARAVNALAYTVGRDVVFGPQSQPGTNRQLLAHELTHVVHQSQPGSVQEGSQTGLSSSPPECAVDQMTEKALRGGQRGCLLESNTRAIPPVCVLQRSPGPEADINTLDWKTGVLMAEKAAQKPKTKKKAEKYYKALLVRAAQKVTAPPPLVNKVITIKDINWSWKKSVEYSATTDPKRVDNYPHNYWKWLTFHPGAIATEEAFTVSLILHELDHAAHAKALYDEWKKSTEKQKKSWDDFCVEHFAKWTEAAMKIPKPGLVGALTGLPEKIRPSAMEFRAYVTQFVNFFHKLSVDNQGFVARGVILFYPLKRQKVAEKISDPKMDVSTSRKKLVDYFRSPPVGDKKRQIIVKARVYTELKSALLLFRPADVKEIRQDFKEIFDYSLSREEARGATKAYRPEVI